ncbi:MAG: hypothetical protein K0R71_741 [Bacillales bacterium]|jgi:hypothetical protein|nr:hypothetical protein [Bacillales bacterium]
MGNIRISQKSAILIERLRAQGCSDEQLVKWIENDDNKQFEKFNDDVYTFDTFLSYAKEYKEDIKGAIQIGYQITFNTMGGLRYWIENAFGLREEIDFLAEEGKKLGLKLNSDQKEKLKRCLASNWVMIEKNGCVDLIVYAIWLQDNN